MIRSKPLVITLFVVELAALALLAAPVLAQQPTSLLTKHQAAGLTCATCHKEDPPSKGVQAPTCFGCHGDLQKVAERTQKLPHNPHNSHRPDFECDACHHLHKPSEDRCTPCHQFGVRVP